VKDHDPYQGDRTQRVEVAVSRAFLKTFVAGPDFNFAGTLINISLIWTRGFHAAQNRNRNAARHLKLIRSREATPSVIAAYVTTLKLSPREG